jgi:hypothetical protein
MGALIGVCDSNPRGRMHYSYCRHVAAGKQSMKAPDRSAVARPSLENRGMHQLFMVRRQRGDAMPCHHGAAVDRISGVSSFAERRWCRY